MITKHKWFNPNTLSALVIVIVLAVIGAKLLFTSHASELLPGDANSDGVVNISDLAILAAHYGTKTGATWSEGDFNGDGAVNIEDLSILASHWGDVQVVAAPTVSLSALPTSVTSGGTSTLTWSTTGATSCTASGAWSGSEATSGSTTTAALTTTSTYSLSCSGAGGSGSASAIVTVNTGTTGGCTDAGVVAPCIGSASTGAPGWGIPVFDDEFNGTSLDSTKWSSSWFNGGTQNGVSTSASNVSVSGGDLILTLASSSSGASVSTNPNGGASTGFQFGDDYYVEASIYFPGSGTSIYNWPAFWATGQSWPTDGEDDIAEGLGTLTSNYHSPLGANNSGTIAGTWSSGWHTYGMDRENGINYIYWDGQLVRQYTTDDGGSLQYLILNVGSGNTAAYGTSSQVKVDYVRVWQ